MMTATAQHPWLDKTEYPFTLRQFQVNGHQMNYIDEGAGEIILFVHGTPSWSFDFRKVIKGLQQENRCMAIDHIGFGLSDKPKDYDYSTQNHSHTLEQFILKKDLQNITLVLHDFGGPIGMAFALKYPERVKGLIIMNSWLWSSKGEPEYEKFAKILRSPLLPFLYRRLNFSPRFILPKSFGPKNKPESKILKHYRKSFSKASERNGALAFAKSLLNDQDWFESMWQQKEKLQDIPVLFIWGMADPIITPTNLKKFQEGFPDADVYQLEASGHFPQEEEPEKVVKAIQRFLKDENQVLNSPDRF
ncbi:putative Hydrolase or acyltransferase (alpha/beta hydrolase superfamily) [Indibacter alkaliphilus LW1]|uniref:Hydrolase or acyltransferase (Alpha/beta hydrolase superfamily) n=2 Tax=Indibacter TaxID=647744 RepID=S2DSM2_INDAL|nr:putative Hydrolase or acyltransferase (alpha/beta hydrolase superfamily) [Indibacter alkaliphilus LW1]